MWHMAQNAVVARAQNAAWNVRRIRCWHTRTVKCDMCAECGVTHCGRGRIGCMEELAWPPLHHVIHNRSPVPVPMRREEFALTLREVRTLGEIRRQTFGEIRNCRSAMQRSALRHCRGVQWGRVHWRRLPQRLGHSSVLRKRLLELQRQLGVRRATVRIATVRGAAVRGAAVRGAAVRGAAAKWLWTAAVVRDDAHMFLSSMTKEQRAEQRPS